MKPTRSGFDLSNLAAESRRRNQPAYEFWLRQDGTIGVHISTLDQVTRKLNAAEVEPLLNLNRCHPLTLTVEVTTRRTLTELVTGSTYTISPEARAAIEDALLQAQVAAVPLMPPTDFALVAWADELDELACCAAIPGLPFTPGKRYPVDSGTCEFYTPFTQNRRHLNPGTGSEETLSHDCQLSGTDRFLMLTGDDGREHYFVDRPEHTRLPGRQAPDPDQVHPESTLWECFEKPEVPDITTAQPEAFDRCRKLLISQQPC